MLEYHNRLAWLCSFILGQMLEYQNRLAWLCSFILGQMLGYQNGLVWLCRFIMGQMLGYQNRLAWCCSFILGQMLGYQNRLAWLCSFASSGPQLGLVDVFWYTIMDCSRCPFCSFELCPFTCISDHQHCRKMSLACLCVYDCLEPLCTILFLEISFVGKVVGGCFLEISFSGILTVTITIQLYCTKNVLWCQVHSSHIHSHHKTFKYNNRK